MKTCEFCDELENKPNNRFKEIYCNDLESRVVSQTPNFIAIPTLGQIFAGSILIIPRKHVETSAQLDSTLQNELADFLTQLIPIVSRFGEPLFFEHGAKASTGGSCGIYHAHIHVVPTPKKIDPTSFFVEATDSSKGILETLVALRNCEEYLFVGNAEKIVYADVNKLYSRPESQYFRRQLCEYFKLETPWDWRDSLKREAHLLSTVDAFKVANVA
jgi:diadenosine tetraphosphate (Ap4A) HIT family hydrolase